MNNLSEILAPPYWFLIKHSSSESLHSVFITQTPVLAVIAQHHGSDFTGRCSWHSWVFCTHILHLNLCWIWGFKCFTGFQDFNLISFLNPFCTAVRSLTCFLNSSEAQSGKVGLRVRCSFVHFQCCVTIKWVAAPNIKKIEKNKLTSPERRFRIFLRLTSNRNSSTLKCVYCQKWNMWNTSSDGHTVFVWNSW